MIHGVVIAPPILFPGKADVVALTFNDAPLINLVGTRVRLNRPVGVLNPVGIQDMKMTRLGSNGETRVQIDFRFCHITNHGNGVVIVFSDIDDLLGEVIVIPGSENRLRAHEFEREEVIVGGHWDTI